MQVFNVLTKKVINRPNADPITLWHRVGLIKTTSGGNQYLQMFHQPDTDFYIVEHEQGDKEIAAA
jgi:hypothetical protein